ncbi:MAG: hypothetical protein DRN26_00395 [Thermoplasmata archaeon]|nr:MAG: hypothetical protein DRN26_00395 [Thermoplasmata archaeon]
MSDTPEKSARQRAEELMGYLNRDKAINEIFSDGWERQYLIYGKPPREWRRYFRVSIPESPDTAQCKAIAAKLANLLQEATFFYAAAEAQLDALSSGESREYTAAFNKLVAEYKAANKNLPASKTLETMANSKIMDIRGAIQNARLIKNFWKRILEGLVEVRKNVELATWNNSTQAKQEMYGGGNIPQNQPNRGQYGSEVTAAVEEDKINS